MESNEQKALNVGRSSPVYHAFPHIRWELNSMSKLRLSSSTDVPLLRSAEAKPLEYTILSDVNDARVYVKVLVKLVNESVGTGGPSQKVSRLSLNSTLSEDECCEILDDDPMGGVTHYAISKLLEVLSIVQDPTSKKISVQDLFYPNGSLSDDWRPLLRILHLGGTGDAFSQRGAAISLAQIFLTGCLSHSKQVELNSKQISYASLEEPLQALISWIASQLQSSASASLNLVTAPLVNLMKSSEARLIFSKSGGIGYLARHLRSGGKTVRQSSSKSSVTSSVQQLYELCFCLWTLSYECNSSYTVRSHFARDGAVRALVDLISASPREKVVRVALASLRNLATCIPDASVTATGAKKIDSSLFMGEMIACGLMRMVDNLRSRQWTGEFSLTT